MNKYICTRWAFDLSTWTPTLQQLALAVAAVQPEERIRLMKFHFIDDFLSSLVGRLLMRKYINVQSGMDYNEVQFARDERGKPYWVLDDTSATTLKHTPAQLSFNVSHQNDMVLLAGIIAATEDAQDFGVGVDVMKNEYSGGKSLAEFFRIMHNKFAENEWRYIAQPQHNDQQRLKAFMRHWCLKEAYVKELGVGITIDLQKISFTVAEELPKNTADTPVTSTTLCCNNVQMPNWHFEEHFLNNNYCIALAFKNCQIAPAKFEFVKIEDLLVKTVKAQNADILEYCSKALQKQKKSS